MENGLINEHTEPAAMVDTILRLIDRMDMTIKELRDGKVPA
jgi:hypothetical protein